jgi:hypothetical protein
MIFLILKTGNYLTLVLLNIQEQKVSSKIHLLPHLRVEVQRLYHSHLNVLNVNAMGKAISESNISD